MATHQLTKKENIRLLTWNLWFDKHLQEERLRLVLSHIIHLQPDIIAFQELTFVSENFFDDKRLPFSEIYHKVPTTVVDKSWYWEGLYTRFEIEARFMRIPFDDSDMGRGLSLVHIPDLEAEPFSGSNIIQILYSRRKSPERPPDLDSRRKSVMTMPRSMALAIS